MPAGTRLGPYVVLAPIGAGGMVYKACDTKLDRLVAIKVLGGNASNQHTSLRDTRSN